MIERCIVALLLVTARITCAEPVALSPEAIGELYLPDGTAPYPAVVLLRCGGISEHDRAWAQRLNGWGYAALVVDSFTPRGYPDGICARGIVVPPDLRAGDAFAAAAWLCAQPFILGERIGVIGFSHGGSTVLKAILEHVVQSAVTIPFRAAVAYYPRCLPTVARLASDT
jgi:dienelactone hydrolase